MERQSTYTATRAAFAVSPEPDRELTTDDLLAIKRAYLQRGKDAFESLALVISAFGSPIKLDPRRPQTYLVWQRGNITALYYEETGRYLSDAKRYESTEVLSVFVNCPTLKHLLDGDRTHVCYMRRGDVVIESEQRFIPGKWLEAMMSEVEAAAQVAANQQAEINDAFRRKLAKELMIGMDV